MAGHEILKKVFGKPTVNGHHFTKPPTEHKAEERKMPASSSDEDEPPTPPPKDVPEQGLKSPVDADTYFSSLKKSRTNSIYSLSRISFSSQLSQLTSLNLPDPSSLSSSIASIPTARAAAATLSAAAEQIGRWLQKASEVLKGLDAEDDVEWAAAGGREGLGEVDTAIGKFEGLIGIYVTAIEDLQEREDIRNVLAEELKAVVDQMENILNGWASVRKLLRGVKGQVELAMEWEELWNVVLGDIGLEMENLIRLVFEMEETRHKAIFAEPSVDSSSTLNMQELQTIVEEMPVGGRIQTNHRFSLPPTFAASSSVPSGMTNGQEDSSLLALFARMQPLRASLDFLPMTLSNFYIRADSVLPTACQELEARRKGLEKKWKKLESDAEGLRRELGEDRWLLVFRSVGRQAQKLCESVERSIAKLQESFDAGAQHNNQPALAKKVENYEAKKTHYGPAIRRILSIIEKGVNDRLTVNGEILRLQSETRTRWARIEKQMKEMDFALDELNLNKNQQLRDSISSIVSMDRSAIGSSVDTPRSSPASSVIMPSANGHKGDPSGEGRNRRSSGFSSTTTRPGDARRYFSMPPTASTTHLPRLNPVLSTSTPDSWLDSREASPSPGFTQCSSTPTPGSRPRLSKHSNERKPRWNTSPKVNHFDFTNKPLTITPTPNRKSPMSFRSPRSASSFSSNVALPSPLGRSDLASVSPLPTSLYHACHLSESQVSPISQDGRQISSSPVRPTYSASQTTTNPPRSRAKALPSVAINGTPPSSSRRQSNFIASSPATPSENPSPSTQVPKQTRPGTAMAGGRRTSMLPVPKHSSSVIRSDSPAPGRHSLSNRASISVMRFAGRESVMEQRDRNWK